MTATQNNYITVSRRALDLEDYIDVARRHAGWIAGPAFAGMVLSICFAFFQPNVYQSEARMQITPAQVSEELVKNTVNSQLYERVVQMQTAIMSRTSLSAIMQDPKLNLYPAERASMPLEDVIEKMRHDVVISINPNDAALRRGGASTFSISFSYPKRMQAHDTVQLLVTKFEDENQLQQRDQQALLGNFFGDELQQAKADLEKRNEELTKFRNANQGRLPEQSQMNMQMLASLQTQYNGINDQLNRLTTDRVRLEAQLSSLKAQLSFAQSLSQDTSSGGFFIGPASKQNEELGALNRQIDAGQMTLQQLLQQYKETYPDVRNLQNHLKVLKQRRDDLQAQQDKQQVDDASKPKEPVRKNTNVQAVQNELNVQTQIDQTNSLLKNNDFDRANKVKEAERLTREIENYQGKLSATSSIEAQYMDLNRDYTNAAQKYQDTLKKKELTNQNGDLIQRRATENLEVLDPASVPTKQKSPNRLQIVGIGFFISIVIGLALAGVQEAKDTSLKNLKDVRAYTNLPVLSSIPLLENTVLVKRKKRIALLVWSAAVAVGLIAIGIAVFYYLTVTANS